MGSSSSEPRRTTSWRPARIRTPLRLLDDLEVDGLDVRPDAVAVAAERVLGEAGLVLRRELVADLRLHLVERRTVGRRLLHGRDQGGEVAADARRGPLW